MKEETKQAPAEELTQEQQDERWKLMTEIATLHNTGKKDELMAFINSNIEAVAKHALSMAINTIELSREFVGKHHEVLTKLVDLSDDPQLDFRDFFRLELLKDLLKETNSVETR